MKKIKSIEPKLVLPKLVKVEVDKKVGDFPLKYYSYSSFVKFSTNPIMFKIKYINGDEIESAKNISGVIGKAFHLAMEEYYEKKDEDESLSIQKGLECGMEFLSEYKDGYINYSSVIANKQKAQEIFVFAYNSYVQEKGKEDVELVGLERKIELAVCVEWKEKQISLPIPLMGYVDKIIKKDGKLVIVDYKIARAFSDPDKIDGAKILQAIQYYFLVYAEFGEAPYSMIFEEVKTSKNRDGSSQVMMYEIVYEKNVLFFDFYFRFYEDMTRAINGEAVFVPNINDFFDNEVAIVSYIHRLDVGEEQAKLMKKLKVNNITDLLKAKIEHAGNMRHLLKLAEEKFVSAKSLNYNSMQNEEKIQTKLMEHGMLLKFDSKIEGNAIDLYRYNPSIGLKMSKLKSYVADIEQVVGVSGVRVLAPIPNSSLVGFEVPRSNRNFPEYIPKTEDFKLAIGVDVMGEVYRFDIRKAPHLLIAGATGSGKSVFLNSIITQLSSLVNVDLHLFDPKMVELSQFRKNAVEYYSEIEDIYLALDNLVGLMNSRYKILSDAGARNIQEYQGDMKYKFVIIDEFGDLVVGNKILSEEVRTGEKFQKGDRSGEYKTKTEKINLSSEISKSILLLAQKARACGIHLIIATQRPSVDIITGSIKANFPTKVAFRTAKAIDSQVLLDEAGAEKLLGKGDMIFASDEGQIRLQGFNV